MAIDIQEYLIALGYRLKEDDQKKFDGALASTASKVATLGAATFATATAIELAVERIASKYNDLYYASARTGASVQNIQQTEFGYKQIGLSADEARGSIEAFATASRINPGLSAILGSAGVDLKADKKKQYDQFLDFLVGIGKTGPAAYAAAANYASLFGISEKVLLHRKLFGAEEKQQELDQRKRYQSAGINADMAAERFKDFARSVNRLDDDFYILGQRIALDWVGPVEKGINAVDAIVQSISNADKATRGWTLTAGAFAGTAFGAWVLKGAKNMMFGGGAAGKASEKTALKSAEEVAAAAAMPAGKAVARSALKGAIKMLLGYIGMGWVGAIIDADPTNMTELEEHAAHPERYGAPLSKGERAELPEGMAKNNPGNVTDSAGNIVSYASPQQGLIELARSLEFLGKNHIDTLAKLSPYVDKSDPKAAARDMSDRTGVRADQQFDLSDPATLKAIMDATIYRAQGMEHDNPYYDDLDGAIAGSRLGGSRAGAGGVVNIQNTTTVTVDGVKDPEVAAHRVGAAVDRSNRKWSDIVGEIKSGTEGIVPGGNQ